jgi:nitroreductase
MDIEHSAVSNARSRLLARYRDPQLANHFDGPAWNAVLDTMLAHRTVRAYRDEPLPPGLLETLIAAAQLAPTSSNLQAWSVVAVQDPDRKARLSELAAGQRHIVDAPLLPVFLADLARLRTARKLASKELCGPIRNATAGDFYLV